MSNKTLVSNLEMQPMNGNTVKANPLPGVAQPQDVQLQTNQLLGHVGTGITGVSLVGTNGITVNSNSVTNTLTIDGAGLGDSVPIGTIMFFATSTPPAGWFECNGQPLATSNYPDLSAVIGYKYGGSGNTFYLPDLRGQFVRGWDHGLGIDSGRTFGSNQNDQLQKFDLSAETGVVPGSATDVVMQFQNGRGYNTGSTGGSGVITDGTAWKTSPSSYTKVTPVNANVGSETRPTNVALLPCIKYATNQTLNNFGLSAQQVLNAVNNLNFQASLNTNGYQKLPSGLIIQWGKATNTITGSVTVTFPIAFPNSCFSVVATDNATGVTSCDIVGISTITKTAFLAYASTNADTAAAIDFNWMAFGN